MSRFVRALQLLFPLSLGSSLGLAAMSILGPTLHAAGMSPSLTITAPSNGSTVTGTVDVWATASDVGFAGIILGMSSVTTDLTFATTGGSAPPPAPTAPQIRDHVLRLKLSPGAREEHALMMLTSWLADPRGDASDVLNVA